jgi:indolepyruvate ferredoxin oxidoreductase, beta subunit
MKSAACDPQIVICGRGGQGVLFLTRLIGEVATATGCSVISSETHGMAMRGGSVISCIRIGPYASPHIPAGRADIILALSDEELQLNRHLLNSATGCVFVNTSRRKKHSVDASKLALTCGSALAVNLVLLGFAAAHDPFPLRYKTILQTLEHLGPERHRPVNLKALTAGYDAGVVVR